MAYRPYFKYGIEQLQEVVAASRADLKVMKVIQYELSFRDKPKARALKAEVDELVRRLSAGAAPPPSHPTSQPPRIASSEQSFAQPSPATPDRLAVECANCKTPNFVSTLEGVMQHLSCSACKSPYEAQFKYGVMRTTFQNTPTESSNSTMKWILIVLAALVVIVLLAK